MPSVGGGGGSGGLATVLYNNTLTVADLFDVDNIPQTYDDLELRLVARSNVIGQTVDTVFMLANNDLTATNYRNEVHYGTGNTTAAGPEADNPALGDVSGASSQANEFGLVKIWIPNYASTTQTKNALAQSFVRRAAAVLIVLNWGWNWESTAAINRLFLYPDGYSTEKFIAGSKLTVIGWKWS